METLPPLPSLFSLKPSIYQQPCRDLQSPGLHFYFSSSRVLCTFSLCLCVPASGLLCILTGCLSWLDVSLAPTQASIVFLFLDAAEGKRRAGEAIEREKENRSLEETSGYCGAHNEAPTMEPQEPLRRHGSNSTGRFVASYSMWPLLINSLKVNNSGWLMCLSRSCLDPSYKIDLT